MLLRIKLIKDTLLPIKIKLKYTAYSIDKPGDT